MDGNRNPLLLIFLLFLSQIVFAQSPTNRFLEVKAKSGDGIGVLLNRYNLSAYSCNVDSFLKINNLQKTDFLKIGIKYKLPIKVYEFNGKTIRESVGISDYRLALQVHKYNDELTQLGVKEADYKLDKEVWFPIHLLYCPKSPEIVEKTEVKKPTEVELTDEKETSNQSESKALEYNDFPIFGEVYRKTPMVSKRLKDNIYYLVSGHGGPDPGAVARKDGNLLCEDEYAYDVTLRLARNLLQHGATVYMITRDENDGIRDAVYLLPDDDETVWYKQPIYRNHRKRLAQRTEIINGLYAKHSKEGFTNQRVIEIHVDSRYADQKVDIFFYHFPGSEVGRIMAQTLLETIKAKYAEHQKDRGYRGVVRGRDLHTLRECKPPVVYIEIGNITNEFDQKRLLIVNNRQAMANWLCSGILTFEKK